MFSSIVQVGVLEATIFYYCYTWITGFLTSGIFISPSCGSIITLTSNDSLPGGSSAVIVTPTTSDFSTAESGDSDTVVVILVVVCVVLVLLPVTGVTISCMIMRKRRTNKVTLEKPGM